MARLPFLLAVFLLALAPRLAAQPTLTGFSLIDAGSDTVIGPLNAGDTITRTPTSPALNIRADVSGTVGSVVFSLTGAASTSRTESVAPFALFGDSNGNYNPWNPPLGSYTLTATPWSGTGATGTAGTPLTVQFTVGNGGVAVYRLNVVGGSGSGDYPAGTVVPIAAGPPGPGQSFLGWVGDTAAVASPSSASTTVTLPAGPVTVTATYSLPPSGDGTVTVHGELRRWHRVTLDLAGPSATESGTPNPFTDFRFDVTFLHPATGLTYRVPGYFAADGQAAETGAAGGSVWRAHLRPDHPGEWRWTVSFLAGSAVAIDPTVAGVPQAPFHGVSGTFEVGETDKAEPDLRAASRGRLRYVGERYPRFAGGDRFIKTGTDSPENLLNYREFDGTYADSGTDRTKLWEAHVADWRPGDPQWRGQLGRGLIGAINYLAAAGQNVFSFLTYNVGGDSKDVWPFVAPTERFRYDCSKLDQWGLVLEHAAQRGFFLHFKLQEQENDNGPSGLDQGELGPERRLYFRELVARFGHLPALNWNLGEENTQTTAQRIAMAQWFHDHDPYRHPVVVHTFPGDKTPVYTPLLGNASRLHGASLQSDWQQVFKDTLRWVRESTASGRPWIVANDEQGGANNGIPPDPGWPGYNGGGPNRAQLRHHVLWGHLMAGGAGVEAYFGYGHPESDLTCDDFRSRAGWWALNAHARRFFERYLPYWRMQPANDLVGNASEDVAGPLALAAPGEVYAVYLPSASSPPALDLSAVPAGRSFQVRWYDPRSGGDLQRGTVSSVTSGGPVDLGAPPAAPAEDWAILVFIPRSVLFVRGGSGSAGFFEGGSDSHLADITNTSTSGGNHGWFELAEALRADGFEPLQVTEAAAPADQPVDLAALDLSAHAVVVLGSNNAPYTVASVDAAENYVRSGGSLLVISDANFGSSWSDAPNSDQAFLDRFGLIMNQDTSTYTLNRSAGDFLAPDHPILSGVGAFDGEGVSPGTLGATAPVGVSRTVLVRARNTVRNNDRPGQGTTRPAAAGDAALVTAIVGTGRVAVHFDRNTFFNLNGAGTNIRRFDNRRYALNLFHWLAGHGTGAGAQASYAAWASTIAWGAQRSLPHLDVDGDGLTNEAESLFALDPLTPDAPRAARVQLGLAAGLPALLIDIRLRAVAASLLQPEASADLIAWRALAPGEAGVGLDLLAADPDGTGLAREVRLAVPLAPAPAQRYVRLTLRHP